MTRVPFIYTSLTLLGASAIDLNNDGFIDLMVQPESTTTRPKVWMNNNYTYVLNSSTTLPPMSMHEYANWVWGDCDNDGVSYIFFSRQ